MTARDRDRPAVMARFWAKVDFSDIAGCWKWTGCTIKGYGRFHVDGTRRRAHRFLYEDLTGAVPAGFEIDHLCRVRNCVNPTHLEVVTKTENVRRGESPTAINGRKMACVNGHEFTDSNTRTYVRRDRVRRTCRECERIRHALEVER